MDVIAPVAICAWNRATHPEGYDDAITKDAEPAKRLEAMGRAETDRRASERERNRADFPLLAGMPLTWCARHILKRDWSAASNTAAKSAGSMGCARVPRTSEETRKSSTPAELARWMAFVANQKPRWTWSASRGRSRNSGRTTFFSAWSIRRLRRRWATGRWRQRHPCLHHAGTFRFWVDVKVPKSPRNPEASPASRAQHDARGLEQWQARRIAGG